MNYIELESDKVYALELPNGDIIRVSVNSDENYPGIDVEVVNKNEPCNLASRPRMLIESPYDDANDTYDKTRLLVWADAKEEDFTHEIEFIRNSNKNDLKYPNIAQCYDKQYLYDNLRTCELKIIEDILQAQADEKIDLSEPEYDEDGELSFDQNWNLIVYDDKYVENGYETLVLKWLYSYEDTGYMVSVVHELPSFYVYKNVIVLPEDDINEIVCEKLSDDFDYCVKEVEFETKKINNKENPMYDIIITNIKWDLED